MPSKEELEAMGITNSDIKNNKNNFSQNKTNGVANIIKTIAIITAVIGVIFGLYAIDGLNMDEGAIIIIIASIISSVFVYALGEIIQLLEDIKNK